MTIKAIETSYKGYRFRSRLEARWAVFFDALGIEWEYEKEGYELPNIKNSELYKSLKENFEQDSNQESSIEFYDSDAQTIYYLPDFYLPEYSCFIEIKGQLNNRDDLVKCSRLSFHSRTPVYVFGNIPETIQKKSKSGLYAISYSKKFKNETLGFCFVGGLKNESTNIFCECISCKTILIGPPYILSKQGDNYDVFEKKDFGMCSIPQNCCSSKFIEFGLSINREIINPQYLLFGESKKISDAFKKARSARFEHGE